MSQDLERLEKWCLNNLKNNPNSIGFIELKSFLEATKANVLKKSEIDSLVKEVISLIDQIKIGNTPKYQILKDTAIAMLMNVLEN